MKPVIHVKDGLDEPVVVHRDGPVPGPVVDPDQVVGCFLFQHQSRLVHERGNPALDDEDRASSRSAHSATASSPFRDLTGGQTNHEAPPQARRSRERNASPAYRPASGGR